MVFCQELGQLLILKALFHKPFKIVTKDAINAQLFKGGGGDLNLTEKFENTP